MKKVIGLWSDQYDPADTMCGEVASGDADPCRLRAFNLDRRQLKTVCDSVRIAVQHKCDRARMVYLEWYTRGVPHDFDEMESLFLESIELNDSPSTRCWYGTFLKEARVDFAAARKQYTQALTMARKPEWSRIRDHPLFLNNIGLLATTEYERGLRDRTALDEAHANFQRAVERVAETDSTFIWPAHSLAYCEHLMRESSSASDPQ